jgi:hypothetical protein
MKNLTDLLANILQTRLKFLKHDFKYLKITAIAKFRSFTPISYIFHESEYIYIIVNIIQNLILC